jgi:N-acetyl sugar amidotransferase
VTYCRRCILPDTRPSIVIGADGVCNACALHGRKATIDWQARERHFAELVSKVKARGARYDCLIPVSGGKDSTWQVVTCLGLGLRPLAPGRTAIGQANLDNLVRLGVDHVDFQVNPEVERRFVREAFTRLGNPAIPMHFGLFNIPVQFAALFDIPLVIYGENPAFEYGGSENAATGFSIDASWLRTHGVNGGTTPEDWIGDTLSRGDLTPYFGPGDELLAQKQISAVFLGYYYQWDPQRTVDVAKAHGFRANASGPRTGYYDFADIDDDFISVHHFLKWYKFGMTRAFDNLSLEIRNGRMTRDEAIGILRERGPEVPAGDIEKFSAYIGIPVNEFWAVAERFRNLAIWERDNSTWRIPGFLIADWRWGAEQETVAAG